MPESRRTADATTTAAAVRSAERSAESIVSDALARASEQEELGIFWALDPQGALAAARRVDERVARGEDPGALAGIPVAVKDCIDVGGLPSTAGVADHPPPASEDAEVVRVARAQGAVPIGKVAMDQLGWTTGGRAPGFPPCLNPLDRDRSPGGSSAGSAAAVAAGAAQLGLGTDVAGSVRVPASYCGLVGLRPAPGMIPTRGVAAFVPSFDCLGVITRSVRDARLALGALGVGSRNVPLPSDREVRIGRLDDLFEAASPEVAERCAAVLASLEAPLRVDPTALEWRPRGLGRLLAGELWRTWGERIGAEPERFTELIRESAEIGEGIDDGVLRELRGRFAVERVELDARLDAFDLLACPTVPDPVPLTGAEAVEASTRFTRSFSTLGWPAISIPVATDGGGMPIGLQLASRAAGLGDLLAAAEAVEATVDESLC